MTIHIYWKKSMRNKTVTLAEIAEAIRLSPLIKQSSGDFFRTKEFLDSDMQMRQYITHVDAIGAAAIVLNVRPNDLYEAMCDPDLPSSFGDTIAMWNDSTLNYSFNEISNLIRTRYAGQLNTEFTVPDCVTYVRSKHGYRRNYRQAYT